MTDTDVETSEPSNEEAAHPVRAWLWPGEWREAVARWVLLLLITSIAASAVAVHRWLAVIGVAVGLALLAVRRRAANADDQAEEDQVEAEGPLPTPDDMADIVRELGTGTGVLLTGLRDQLLLEYPGHAWTTKDVRVLLGAAEVRVREGVRVSGVGNGPGVHREDIQALPSPAPSDPSVGVVGAGQDANTNTNNIKVTRSASGAQITVTPARAVVDKV
ncbi:hypothetical protein [Streptomyces sp. NPDC001876]|uniref:hypothetical protein n=1 Tax=Streptomyces sp. NPDC001876 TaxID=3154402 RepID=UPI0033270A92